MILFSLTINIDNAVRDEWLLWMKEHFIPSLWLTGYFVEKRFLHLLTEPEDGSTYSLQLFLKDKQDYSFFEEQHLQDFRKILYGKYEGNIVDFSTVLETVDV